MIEMSKQCTCTPSLQVLEKADPGVENSPEVIVYKIEVPANRYDYTFLHNLKYNTVVV